MKRGPRPGRVWGERKASRPGPKRNQLGERALHGAVVSPRKRKKSLCLKTILAPYVLAPQHHEWSDRRIEPAREPCAIKSIRKPIYFPKFLQQLRCTVIEADNLAKLRTITCFVLNHLAPNLYSSEQQHSTRVIAIFFDRPNHVPE